MTYLVIFAAAILAVGLLTINQLENHLEEYKDLQEDQKQIRQDSGALRT